MSELTQEQLDAEDPLKGALGEGDLSLGELAGIDLGDVSAVRFEVLPRILGFFEIEETSMTRRGDENIPVVTLKSKLLEIETWLDNIPEGKTDEDYIGKSHTESFWLRDMESIGRFRAFCEDAGMPEEMYAAKLVDVLNNCKGHRYVGLVKHRKDKNDASIVYAGIQAKGGIESTA